jgi:hypothetical protein
MQTPTQARTQAALVAELVGYMKRQKVSAQDLTEIGGEDLNSPNPACASKARSVAKCWELLARLGLEHSDLEVQRKTPHAPHSSKFRVLP